MLLVKRTSQRAKERESSELRTDLAEPAVLGEDLRSSSGKERRETRRERAHLEVRPRQHVLLRHGIVQPRDFVRHSALVNLEMLALQPRDDDLAWESS